MTLDQTANQLDKVNWRIFTNTIPISNLLFLTKRENEWSNLLSSYLLHVIVTVAQKLY